MVVATITDPSFNLPFGVAFDPHNDRVYVTNIAGDMVSVISDSTNKVIATITDSSFNAPYDIAFDPMTTKCT